MTCEEAREQIGPYVDDDLTTEARRRVEMHLLTCRDCAWEAQSLTITRSRLREGIGEVVASDAFRARALASLYADNPHIASPEPETADAGQYRLPMGV